jgi:RNA polymerase sigma factor (sigma-70 family)
LDIEVSRTQEGVPGEIATSPDAGQTAAVDALYRAMRLDLVRLASGLIDDVRVAEEIVQDAFVGLYRNWRELADEASAPAYVKRSVINAAYSELRHRSVRRRRFEPPPAASTESAEALALLAQEHRDTVAAVRSLPARQREVVLLRYWQA